MIAVVRTGGFKFLKVDAGAHIQILFGGCQHVLDRLNFLDRLDVYRLFVLLRNFDTSSTD